MFNSQCSILIRTEGGRASPSGSDRSRSSNWSDSAKVRYLDTSGPSMARRSTRPWERRHLLSTDWGVRSYLALGERLAIRHPVRLRIAYWELNIGQILGSDAEQWIMPSYFCASPRDKNSSPRRSRADRKRRSGADQENSVVDRHP